ncbi:long-chain-fatty-acid--CoA ligase ACSBG2-like isoform X1 [Ostrea edulis]|uniref:long-chain-fatty-acid--CoA ligase ACSBG2-like isoform X1 n=1 Tax=Ostrea edulis TaxID=37623 RepID=UPI0024AFCD03|nr:long-chain-fatty-acid--CoA ligase ACSBG2-like isoform X1 [Ostrea edulis]XP_056021145.1 long-chain-fatty-acid--CoA ligase ACSBG2-like isoform X1 [Ostrea edulis]XP_056021146.1 long-chain-fatty-acid--CoA ligase ACSBG2-like isoform X1 [Ostrea edulis]XP_056021147.1 long-chain-fatty-acid--CoA ligase ACSBG2-like isoform X1 [Ostrea edulis]XP_056021149.1 long-chain-fatty-acid--CoA ligase ACSBG2-like isoform X1 [Ostrea edulis]XP_056021150.1 long-chain-fatty-acid--CoA ligase ACSBG2-like isoform X1 [Os
MAEVVDGLEGSVKLESVKRNPADPAVNGNGDIQVNNNIKQDVVTDPAIDAKAVAAGGESKQGGPPDNAFKDLDDLAPATEYVVTKGDSAVKLRMNESGYGSEKPVTVPSMFYKTVQRVPMHTALAVKRGGIWVKWTYEQYFNDTRKAAKSFIKLGVEPTHGVGILGFNAPEWFISNNGAIFAGAFSVGIYATNNAEACKYVALSATCNVIVVENNQQLKKILQIWEELPDLKAVIQYTGEVAEKRENVYSWKEFMELSNGVPDDVLQQRLSLMAPNKACSLIYTSGTTGNPKGVMLSHDNLTWTAAMIQENIQYTFADNVVVTYLPLSHIAGMMVDIYLPIVTATTVYFAEPDALRGSLLTTLKEVRPTAFLGVPRVWEKMIEGMKHKAREFGFLKKKVGAWARGVGYRTTVAEMNHESVPGAFKFADIFLKKVKTDLGFDQCKFFISGAAPIMRETIEFFYGLHIPLMEVYGMSECAGPHTTNRPDLFRTSSVGTELPGMKTKLADMDQEGNGEVRMYGRHVFMGYLNDEEKTRETFDEELYLMSGDIGKKDKDGFLYITGRKKELIITAGGENIPPVLIEDNVKECLPCVSNCILIGDKRKFLSMLITLKVDVNPDTLEPTDNLTALCMDWMKAQGSASAKVSDILDNKDAIVLKAIQQGIDKANDRAISRAQKIQKWSLLPRDFSIPGGELGPTMKLRRPIVHKMYAKTIDAFYEE